MKTVRTSDERQHERQRVALLCVDLIFAHTRLPSGIVKMVREVAVRYGIGAGVAMAEAVLCAFEEGRAWGEHRERERRAERDAGKL